jgi:hypothetical protein
MKKQSIIALVLFLLIPVVLRLGGLLFSVINPEVAAGHLDYARNYHRLSLLKNLSFFGSLAVAALLCLLVFLLVIRSKRRSPLWMLLAVFGPFGFAILSMLNDRDPAETDRYARFQRNLHAPARGAWELGVFISIWVLGWQAMVLKRTLSIWREAVTTGVSTAQIIAVRDASGGMWAFSEGNEVMYFVILLYLLLPIGFYFLSPVAARIASPRPR